MLSARCAGARRACMPGFLRGSEWLLQRAILERSGLFEIAGLIVSDLPAGTVRFGYRVLGSEVDLPVLIEQNEIQAGVIAVGDNWARSQFLARIGSFCPALPFVTAVHPSAQIGRDVRIGDGTVIMAGAVGAASSP